MCPDRSPAKASAAAQDAAPRARGEASHGLLPGEMESRNFLRRELLLLRSSGTKGAGQRAELSQQRRAGVCNSRGCSSPQKPMWFQLTCTRTPGTQPGARLPCGTRGQRLPECCHQVSPGVTGPLAAALGVASLGEAECHYCHRTKKRRLPVPRCSQLAAPALGCMAGARRGLQAMSWEVNA